MGEKREVHQLKPAHENWNVDDDGRSVEEILTLINGIDQASIQRAATAYDDARRAVETARDSIKEEAHKLARVWEGEASVNAQRALGLLYASMDELVKALRPTHTTMNDFAIMVREHQAFLNDNWKGIMPTWHRTDRTWDDSIPDLFSAYQGYFKGNNAGNDFGSPDELAGLHLRTFGEDLQHVYSRLPGTVETTLPNLTPDNGLDDDGPDPVTYNGDPNVGNTGSVPYGGFGPGSDGSGLPDAGLEGSTGPDGLPQGSIGPISGGTGPSGTSPSGLPDGSLPTNPTTPGDQTPGGPGTPNLTPASNPAGTGPNGTTLQDYRPGANTPTGPNLPNGGSPTTTGYGSPNAGPGTYGPGALMGPGAGAGTTSSRNRAPSGTGMPFLPMAGMGGAGGGEESRDRESSTWLHEDDDIWGGDADQAVNSRIG